MQAERLNASLENFNDLKAASDKHALTALTGPQGKNICVNGRLCAISEHSHEELPL